MKNHVYKRLEVTGSSSVSSDDAIQQAIAKLSESVSTLRWFEVIETRGHIEDGKVAYWQVTLSVGATL